jgi:hypothetical protein
MSILTIILICFGAVSLWMLFNPLTKKRKTPQNPTEPTTVVKPLEEEPNNIEPVLETPNLEPVEGEMPEKPLPVNCQLAQFQPAPQDFFYVDCCGTPQKGEGFQPWEKRSPVSIDANKPFVGMTLLDQEADINC